MATGETTEQEKKDIRETFNILDVDGDGKLSTAELETLLRSHFVVGCDKELADLLDKMDSDKNGYVDYDEFEEYVTKNNLCRTNAEEVSEEMRGAFQVFDRDDDGFIDIGEFSEVMKTIGDKMSDEEVAQLMKQADVNGDGKIDYNEFCTFMAKGIF